MKAVYSNTACPKLVKWMAIVAALVGVACFLACGFLEKGYIAILFISVLVVVQQILFNKVCKK